MRVAEAHPRKRRASSTRERVLTSTNRLFRDQGVAATSMQQIATASNLTKAALYYHFASRDELVRALVEPVVESGDAMVANLEAMASTAPVGTDHVVAAVFDHSHHNRSGLMLAIGEMRTLTDLGLIDRVVSWRRRLAAVIYAGEPTPQQLVRATLALGGLQDAATQVNEVDLPTLRNTALDAAKSALTEPLR